VPGENDGRGPSQKLRYASGAVMGRFQREARACWGRTYGVCLLAVLLTAGATLGSPGLSAVRESYEAGKYEDALARAEAAIRAAQVSSERVALHEWAALAAFNLKSYEVARRHFQSLLSEAPKYAPDPLMVAPPAIRFFEDVRAKALAVRPPYVRRFGVGLGMLQLIAFHRFVETDGAGNTFMNRAPYGPMLSIQLRLTEGWWFVGEGAFGYMHVTPYSEALARSMWLDYHAINVSVGIRKHLAFDGFAIVVGAQLGSSRRFLSAREGAVATYGVRSQALTAELTGGVDLPITAALGVLLRAGLGAHVPTEPIGRFDPAITFAPQQDGLLWGLQNSAEVYFRF
jgi:hypothetical protein